MVDVEGQLLSVLGRGVTGGRTIYDVAHSSGLTLSTFDAALAGKANGLTGAPVTTRYDITYRPNPRKPGEMYTNYVLIDVAPAGQPLAAAQTQAPLQGAPVGVPMGAGPAEGIPMAPPRQGGGNDRGMSPEREERVMRQNASTAALNFVGHLFSGAGPTTVQEALSLVKQITEALLTYDKSGAWTGALTSPQEVAAFVNAEVPAGVTVGVPQQQTTNQAPDIPWTQGQ